MVAITIKNNAESTVYIYNFDYGTQPALGVVAIPIHAKKSILLTLKNTNQMRIYIADNLLTESIEKMGCAPDPFNINCDGGVMYSFVEYTASDSEYTVDVSYINEYSFPLTLMFTGVTSGVNAIDNFEYGFKNLSAVITALDAQKDYSWNALVWPANPSTEWGTFPSNMYRIIGPLNAWEQQQANPKTSLGPWEPNSYLPFVTSLPFDGIDLFKSKTNLNGWNEDVTSPSNSGYVKALQGAAIADKNNKYGFFCYPNDNRSGEFTNLPNTVCCTINIYPYNT